MNIRTLLFTLLIFPISTYSIQTYNKIRVLDGDNQISYSHNFTTDEKVTIKVEGQRRDDLSWEPVHADWSFPNSLYTDNILHNYDDKNLIDPSAPFIGKVGIVFNDPGGASFGSSVRLTITPGVPTLVSLSIIDKPDSIYTFDTLSLEVKVYNKDGIFSGPVSHNCTYSLLNNEELKPATFIVNDSAYILDPATLNELSCFQIFTSGTDTVKVIFESATPADSSQLLIFSSQGISDSTVTFPIFDKPVGTSNKSNCIAKKKYGTPTIFMLNGKRIQAKNLKSNIAENLYIQRDHNNKADKAFKSEMLQQNHIDD